MPVTTSALRLNLSLILAIAGADLLEHEFELDVVLQDELVLEQDLREIRIAVAFGIRRSE